MIPISISEFKYFFISFSPLTFNFEVLIFNYRISVSGSRIGCMLTVNKAHSASVEKNLSSSAFLKVTGMTPGEYRRSKRTLSTQENEKDFYPVIYAEKQKQKRKRKN